MAGNAMSLGQTVKIFMPLLRHLGWYQRGAAAASPAACMPAQPITAKNSGA